MHYYVKILFIHIVVDDWGDIVLTKGEDALPLEGDTSMEVGKRDHDRLLIRLVKIIDHVIVNRHDRRYDRSWLIDDQFMLLYFIIY